MTYSLRESDLADAKRELQRMIAAGQVTVDTPLFKPGAVLRRMMRSDGSKKQQPAQSPIAPTPTPSPAAPSSLAGAVTHKEPQGGAGNASTPTLIAATPQKDLTPQAALARWLTIQQYRTDGMKRKAIAAKLGIPLRHVIYNLRKKTP